MPNAVDEFLHGKRERQNDIGFIHFFIRIFCIQDEQNRQVRILGAQRLANTPSAGPQRCGIDDDDICLAAFL